MKIGFFGGCFNPPTIAHVALAQKALYEAKLDKVIFMPIGDFYKKKELAPARDRYNMLKIAIEGLNNIEVSDLELGIKENIYAIDAFKLIKKNYPNDDIYFIMGADNFVNIINWKDGKKLIENYKYIVIDRKSIDIEDYVNKYLQHFRDKIIIIKNEEFRNLSSSEFRENKKNGKNNSCIVQNNVLKYIEEKELYNNLGSGH